MSKPSRLSWQLLMIGPGIDRITPDVQDKLASLLDLLPATVHITVQTDAGRSTFRAIGRATASIRSIAWWRPSPPRAESLASACLLIAAHRRLRSGMETAMATAYDPYAMLRLVGVNIRRLRSDRAMSCALDAQETGITFGQQHIGRPLLTPDEVRTLPADRQLLFLAGQRPVVAAKLRYYADREFAGRFDRA